MTALCGVQLIQYGYVVLRSEDVYLFLFVCNGMHLVTYHIYTCALCGCGSLVMMWPVLAVVPWLAFPLLLYLPSYLDLSEHRGGRKSQPVRKWRVWQ